MQIRVGRGSELQEKLTDIVHQARLAFIDGHGGGGVAAYDGHPPFLNSCLADGMVQLRGDVVEGDACGKGK